MNPAYELNMPQVVSQTNVSKVWWNHRIKFKSNPTEFTKRDNKQGYQYDAMDTTNQFHNT